METNSMHENLKRQLGTLLPRYTATKPRNTYDHGLRRQVLDVNLSTQAIAETKISDDILEDTSAVEVWPQKSYGTGWEKNGRE